MPATIVTERCVTCSGRGYTACWKCGGSGQVKWGECWPCGGTGASDKRCSACKGKCVTTNRMWMPESHAEASEFVDEIEQMSVSEDLDAYVSAFWRAYNFCPPFRRRILFPESLMQRVRASHRMKHAR